MKNFYSGKFSGILFFLLCVNAFFVWRVDPFAIFHAASINPSKPYKVDLFYSLRLTKSYQLEYLKPDYLVMGSSRVSSIDPLPLQRNGGASYNAALPGITAYELLRYYQHAVSVGSPRRVIIGLDYESFLVDGDRFRIGFSDQRLVRSKADLSLPKAIWRHYNDYLDNFISMNSSITAFRAVMGKDIDGNIFFSNGTWGPNPNKKAFLIGLGGFKFITNEYLQQLSHQRPMYELTYLKEMTEESCRNKIDTVFFITPAHNEMAAVYERTGHILSRAQWQRDVASLVRDANRSCSVQLFSLWGFEDNEVPSIPPNAEVLQSRVLFTDGLHLSRAFSSAILAEILGNRAPVLGRRIDAQSIDVYIDSTSQRTGNYLASFGLGR